DRGELSAALALRDAIREVFAPISRGERPAAWALKRLGEHHARAASEARLDVDGDAWRLKWPRRDLRTIRFSVAVDAVSLLTDREQLSRVRLCPGHNCGWLFLDTSGRRRWCSMEVYGSRAKMRRLYARRRSG